MVSGAPENSKIFGFPERFILFRNRNNGSTINRNCFRVAGPNRCVFLGGDEKRKIGASHPNFILPMRRKFREFHRENYILVLPGIFRCGRWYVKSNLTSGSILLKSLSSLEHGNQHRIVSDIVASTRRLLQLSESSSRSEFATKLQLG